MSLTKTIMAGTAVVTIASSVALAQQAQTGTVTRIDRLNGTVSIQQTQSGTVGASGGGAAEQFKAHDGSWLEKLHAGDKVSFSATEAGGVKTITKLDRQ